MNVPDIVQLGSFGLVDLVVALVIIGSAVAALRRRSGVLGALGAVLGSALACWLVVVALAVWAPTDLAGLARSSQVLTVLPPPYAAINELQRLVGGIAH